MTCGVKDTDAVYHSLLTIFALGNCWYTIILAAAGGERGKGVEIWHFYAPENSARDGDIVQFGELAEHGQN